MKNPSLNVGAAGLEFLRSYDPAVTYWGLTAVGKARVKEGMIPHGIGFKGPDALSRLDKVSAAEEDEIGDWLGLTPRDTKFLLKRLAGYGLVAQAG